MRVMVFVKATEDSENGAPPTTEAWEAMARFNEELVQASVMLAAAGLKPSAEAKRIAFDPIWARARSRSGRSSRRRIWPSL